MGHVTKDSTSGGGCLSAVFGKSIHGTQDPWPSYPIKASFSNGHSDKRQSRENTECTVLYNRLTANSASARESQPLFDWNWSTGQRLTVGKQRRGQHDITEGSRTRP